MRGPLWAARSPKHLLRAPHPHPEASQSLPAASSKGKQEPSCNPQCPREQRTPQPSGQVPATRGLLGVSANLYSVSQNARPYLTDPRSGSPSGKNTLEGPGRAMRSGHEHAGGWPCGDIGRSLPSARSGEWPRNQPGPHLGLGLRPPALGAASACCVAPALWDPLWADSPSPPGRSRLLAAQCQLVHTTAI